MSKISLKISLLDVFSFTRMQIPNLTQSNAITFTFSINADETIHDGDENRNAKEIQELKANHFLDTHLNRLKNNFLFGQQTYSFWVYLGSRKLRSVLLKLSWDCKNYNQPTNGLILLFMGGGLILMISNHL